MLTYCRNRPERINTMFAYAPGIKYYFMAPSKQREKGDVCIAVYEASYDAEWNMKKERKAAEDAWAWFKLNYSRYHTLMEQGQMNITLSHEKYTSIVGGYGDPAKLN